MLIRFRAAMLRAAVATFFLVAFPLLALAQPQPIVFAHGIGVPAFLYERIVPIQRVFRDLGYDLYIARTPIAGSLQERSAILHDEIQRLVPEGPFHLVGHSMGGLDARIVVSRYPDVGTRCLSVTTLATPNHGAALADWVVAHAEELGDRSSAARAILDLLGSDYQAIQQLTTRYINGELNGRARDVPGIRYYSMGFFIPEPVERHSVVPLLWLAYSLTKQADGSPNDGFVSVASSQWGRSLGVFPADHWSETAPIPFLGGANYKDIAARVVANLREEFD